MRQYKEEGLTFQFTDKWLLPDFQKDGEYVMFDKHPVYDAIQSIGNYKEKDKKGNLVSVRGSKTVDFVGVLDNEIYFIEVKNFRRDADISKEKIEHKAIDIASKVRDSISTIIGGKFNCKEDRQLWKQIVGLINKEENKIQIICWLEFNIPDISEKMAKDILGTYQKKLKQKLEWLIKSKSLLILNKNNFYTNGLNEIFNFEVVGTQ